MNEYSRRSLIKCHLMWLKMFLSRFILYLYKIFIQKYWNTKYLYKGDIPMKYRNLVQPNILYSKNIYLALKIAKTMIVQIPKIVSWYLIAFKFEKTCSTESRKPSVLPGIPKSCLNCDEAILIAAAEVNPVITGREMKSKRKPVNNYFFEIVRL